MTVYYVELFWIRQFNNWFFLVYLKFGNLCDIMYFYFAIINDISFYLKM